jgi:hypothetical protein
MKRLISIALAAAVIGTGLAAPAHGDPQEPYCANEFDWAAPHAAAMKNHGLDDLLYELGIQSALAIDDACGLVPAIGPVATVEKLVRDWRIPTGSAAKIMVAAADVSPEIAPLLG